MNILYKKINTLDSYDETLRCVKFGWSLEKFLLWIGSNFFGVTCAVVTLKSTHPKFNVMFFIANSKLKLC